MAKQPLVNIVVLTTNQFAFIEKCLISVFSSNYKNITVYLVDNNSNKEEYFNFYNKFKTNKKIHFYRRKNALGFGNACNFGIRKIKRGYIVLLNDDMLVTKNWLDSIIEYMEKNPDVGVCQPKIKSMRERDRFEYAGGAGGFIDIYGYPFCRGRIFYTLEKDRGQYNDIRNIAWASGNCLVTKVEVLRKVGLLDDLFFIIGDEVDLCWRMHFHGLRIVYIPSSTVFHYGSGTIGENAIKVFYRHRNSLILLLKNYSNRELLRYLPFRIMLDFIAFWYYLLDNKLPSHAISVLNAYISLFKLLPKIAARRKKAAFKNAENANLLEYPIYKKSIIVEYFINHKKKFSQLKTNNFKF